MTMDELENAGLFIGWLERADTDAQADEYNIRPMLLRTLENPNWVKAETPASLKIIEGPLDRCPDAAQYVP